MRFISNNAESVPKASDTSDLFNLREARSIPGIARGKSTDRLRIPCLSAFLREVALPASVFGPVERLALARLARSLRSEIGSFISSIGAFLASPISLFELESSVSSCWHLDVVWHRDSELSVGGTT